MIINIVDNVDKIIYNNGNNLQAPSRVKHLYQNKNKYWNNFNNYRENKLDMLL